MLIKFIPSLQDNIFVQYIRKLLNPTLTVFLIALLTLISNLFSLEIVVLYIFVGFVVLGTLFADDLLCLLPISCCGYFTFSKINNPLSLSNTSVFLTSEGVTNLIIIAAITTIFALSRLVFDVITKEEKRKFPKLTWGFLALGITYILGGLFSGNYDTKTAFFGLVQIACLSFSYFYFYFTVDFKKVSKGYFAILVSAILFVLSIQSIYMLYDAGFFKGREVFDRSSLYTGWGISNNIAAIMAMCLPVLFYYVIKNKHSWIYLLLANLVLILIIFIQSRNGILFGVFLYFVGFFISLFSIKNNRKNKLIVTQGLILIIVVILIHIFKDFLVAKLNSLIDRGLNDSGRFEIYISGLKQFIKQPIFGNGFYACESFRWGDNTIGEFLPARYHNTIIQLLASSGIVSLIAYLYHRYETLWLCLNKITVEKIIMSLVFLGLPLTSILDCNFFNFGPGFLYSAILLLLEINVVQEKELTNS